MGSFPVALLMNCNYCRQDKKWREVDALKDLKDERIVQCIDSWVEEVSTEWWSHETKRYNWSGLWTIYCIHAVVMVVL